MTRLLLLAILVCTCGNAVTAAFAQDRSTEEQLTAEAFFVKGLTQAYIGKHDLAVGFFRASLKIQPDVPEVVTAMARSHRELGDFETALFFAERWISPESPVDDVLFLSAMLVEADRTSDALELLRGARDFTPLPAYELALVDLLLNLEQYEMVAGVLQELSDSDTYSTAWYVGNLTSLDDRAVTELLEKNPDDLHVIELAAAWYEHIGDLDAAVDLLEGAVDPNHSAGRLAYLQQVREPGLDAATDRADAAIAMADPVADFRDLLASGTPEDLQRAEAFLSGMETRAEDAGMISFLRGELLFAQGDYVEASAQFDRILETDVRNVKVWQRAALSAQRAGKIHHAIDVANEGLLFFPGNTGLIHILAVTSLATDTPTKQPAFFLDAVGYLHSTAADTASNLQLAAAWSYILSGDIDSGAALVNQAFVADGPRAYALALRARVRALSATNGVGATTLEDIEAAIASLPNDYGVVLTAAYVYNSAGRYGEALKQIRRLVDREPTAEVLELAGDIYLALEQLDEARAAWTDALTMDPNRQSVVLKLDQLSQ